MKNFSAYISVILLLTLASCGSDRLDVNTSDSSIQDITVLRLEQDIFKMDTNNIELASNQLRAKYGNFYVTFISMILNNGGLRDSSYSFRMKSFIRDYYMRKAYEESQKKYPKCQAR